MRICQLKQHVTHEVSAFGFPIGWDSVDPIQAISCQGTPYYGAALYLQPTYRLAVL
jgi:hypothetical protein